MPNTVTTPNMLLTIPVNLSDPTPDWGARIQTAFGAIDSHNHTTNQGVPVPTAGLNINADLSIGGFNTTQHRSARFNAQASPLVLGTDLGCLYSVLGDAYWNDGAGTAIQLTKNHVPNFQLSSLNARVNVTGSYTIQATDLFNEFLVNTGGAVTINLPTSAAAGAGRVYFFFDYLGTSETNPITWVPSGTDTIEAVNASITGSLNFAQWCLTTDGAGKWTLTTTAPSFLRSTGVTYGASVASVYTQAAPTSDVAAQNMTFKAPPPFASAVTNISAGSFIFELPAPIGGINSTALLQVKDDMSNHAHFWVGPQQNNSGFVSFWAIATPNTGNYFMACNGSTGTLYFQAASITLQGPLTCTSNVILQSASLQWSAGVVAPALSQSQQTAGAGQPLTLTSQQSQASGNVNGGDLVLNTGAGNGSGQPGLVRFQGNAINTWQWQPWQGAVNSQQRILQTYPWVKRTTAVGAVTVLTIPTVNGSAQLVIVKYCAKDNTTTTIAGGATYQFIVVNSAGTVTSAQVSAQQGHVGASDPANATGCQISISGTNIQVQVVPIGADTVDWQGTVEVHAA